MKSDKIDIGLAGTLDSEAIFRIHFDSVNHFCPANYEKRQVAEWFHGRSPADYVAAIEHKALWIARSAGRPVGFVEFWSKSVSMLYMSPSFAGRGVGTMMLEFALEALVRRGAFLIEIEALTNAQTFYERFGFAKVGESCMMRPSGLKLETVLMERREPSY